MERELVLTDDGSHTIQLGGRVECYHSTFGAIQESNHIFIKCGLEAVLSAKQEIRIFEVGFGTGLNAFLTSVYIENKDIRIIYDTIEAYPIEQALWEKLNYADKSTSVNATGLFDKIHTVSWEQAEAIMPNFTLHKHKGKLEEYQFNDKYDLVYFDAFDPTFQPELWTEEVFRKIYDAMLPGGVLTTYCAKGAVKRAMKAAGFIIEGLPGPPGKREITRAVKG